MTIRRRFLIAGEHLQLRLVQAVSCCRRPGYLKPGAGRSIAGTRACSADAAAILVLLSLNMPGMMFGLLLVGAPSEF
jgi:hypothetical protein